MEDEDIAAFSTQALTIICFLEADGLRLCLSFDDRFCSRDLERTQLRHIETASAEDMQQIWGWNASVPGNVSTCFHDAITATATHLPDAPAVDGWDRRFTYAYLMHAANGADNALFVVFTSGSTGTPKGAVLTHSGFSSATRY
ncbi:nonribosomal peptide synthase [Colletotrichum tofieldiae]|uniref:Nonribosomal peptide synthase n=1 Tax=Colletotrichum tofieldiae TaxID=708197 RepID=A0A166RLD3_9PEZI|nr:nonribosomal peptide synthase [Colletotrichum tofieldiae]